MCEHCVQHRAEIRADLIALLNEEPDSRLLEAVNSRLDDAVREIVEKRIEPAMENNSGLEMPDLRDVRAAIKDCMIAAVCALGCAAIASTTPGYTDEGGEPRSIILGQWANSVLEGEATVIASGMMDELMNHLGMGNN